MTEGEARGWIAERFSDTAADRVAAFLDLVVAETAAQNLIAPSTIAQIWSRHAVDSAQLLTLAPAHTGLWIDIGTGGGFPGLVVALLRDAPMMLVEPRRRRAEFLERCVQALGCTGRITVETAKVQNVAGVATVISARAVATIENLLRAAMHCATQETRWLLPRGQVTDAEIAALRSRWKGMFHVEHSVTASDSMILVIDGAAAR